jgi:hypothetical protein
LSYANLHRPASFYESLFWALLQRFRTSGKLGMGKKCQSAWKIDPLSASNFDPPLAKKILITVDLQPFFDPGHSLSGVP